jgi:hypothetical protein
MLYRVKRIRSTLMEFKASSSNEYIYIYIYIHYFAFFSSSSFLHNIIVVVDDNCLYSTTSSYPHSSFIYIYIYMYDRFYSLKHVKCLYHTLLLDSQYVCIIPSFSFVVVLLKGVNVLFIINCVNSFSVYHSIHPSSLYLSIPNI